MIFSMVAVDGQWCIPGKVSRGGILPCVGKYENMTTYVKEGLNDTWEFPLTYERIYDHSNDDYPMMCQSSTFMECSSCLSGRGSTVCGGCQKFMRSDRCKALGSRCSSSSPDCYCSPTKMTVQHTWATVAGKISLVNIAVQSEPILTKPPGRELSAYDLHPNEFNSTLCPKCEGSVDWCNKNWIPVCKPGIKLSGRRLLSESQSVPWGTDTLTATLLPESITVDVRGTAQTSAYTCVVSLSTLPPFSFTVENFGETSHSYPIEYATTSGTISARLISPTGLLISTYYRDNFVSKPVPYPDSYFSTSWITNYSHWDMPHKLGIFLVVVISLAIMAWTVKIMIGICVSCDKCIRTRFCRRFFCCGAKSEEEHSELLDEKPKLTKEESKRMAAVLRAALAAVVISGVDACDNGLFVPSSFSECRVSGNCTGMFSAIATIPAFGSSLCIGVRDPASGSPLGSLSVDMVSMTQEWVYDYAYVTGAWTIISQQYVNPYSTNDGLGQESYRCHMGYCNTDGSPCTGTYDGSSTLPLCDGWATYSPGNSVYFPTITLLNAKCIKQTKACFPQPVKDGRLLMYPGKNLGTTISTDNTGRHLIWARYSIVWNTAGVVQKYAFSNYIGNFQIDYTTSSGEKTRLFSGVVKVNDVVKAGPFSISLSGYIPSLTASAQPPKYLIYNDFVFTQIIMVGGEDVFSPVNNPVSALIGDIQLPVNAYSDVANMIWASDMVESSVDLFGYRISAVKSGAISPPPGLRSLSQAGLIPLRVSPTSSSLGTFGASFPFATLWQITTEKPITLSRTVSVVCPVADDSFSSSWAGEWSSSIGCSMYVRAKTMDSCDIGMVSVNSDGNMTLFTVSLTLGVDYKTYEIRGFCPDPTVPAGTLTLVGSKSSVSIRYQRTDLAAPAIFANGSANHAFVNMSTTWGEYHGSSSSGWSWGGVGSGISSLFGGAASALGSLAGSLGLESIFGNSGLGSIISQVVTILIYLAMGYGVYLLISFVIAREKAKRIEVKYQKLDQLEEAIDSMKTDAVSASHDKTTPVEKSDGEGFEEVNLSPKPETKVVDYVGTPPWLRAKKTPLAALKSKSVFNQRYTTATMIMIATMFSDMFLDP